MTLDNGIKVELTATTRTGFGRFTYPAGKTATLAINAASDVNHSDDSEHQHRSGCARSERMVYRRVFLPEQEP